MPSSDTPGSQRSERHCVAAVARSARSFAIGIASLVAGFALAPRALAQSQPQGFGLERFYPSAPGAGWFVMDDLTIHGGLGGAVALSVGYAANPLRVAGGSAHLAVVSDQAFADIGVAATYDCWRLYLDLTAPLLTRGQAGTVGNYEFATQPSDLSSNPDSLGDARIGVDRRLVGSYDSPLRVGAGAQLIVPNGNRVEVDSQGTHHDDYGTDGTFRAMGRLLVAGDVGMFTAAGHVGVHVRPLDDSPTPGSPQGSELLFGIAAGVRSRVWLGGPAALVVGPEVYGATAFRSFFGEAGTALEGLLSGRLEETADGGPQLRIKLGTGAGLDPRFGAPAWRVVFAIEVFDHTTTHRLASSNRSGS